MIRVNADVAKMANAIIDLFHHFKWHRIVLISVEHGVCEVYTSGMLAKFRMKNVTIDEYIRVPFKSMVATRTLNDGQIHFYLNRIRETGRSKTFVV